MSKVFKNIMLFILIIACLFNIVYKLVRKYSLKEELRASAQYMLDRQETNETKEMKQINNNKK